MKAFGKMRQLTGEKFGGSSKTETSDDFLKLQQETEVRKEATEKLSEACASYVKTLGAKKEGGFGSSVKKIPLEMLADSMTNYANLLDPDSGYSKALHEFAGTSESLSVAQAEYRSKITSTYQASITSAMVELKDYNTLKKKMESRRLDFDSKLNKLHKAKKEKPELEEEIRVAQIKYEGSLQDLTNKMLTLSNNEDDQLDDLLAFVDSQLDYFTKCVEITKKLQSKLKDYPRNNNSNRHQIPRAKSPVKLGQYTKPYERSGSKVSGNDWDSRSAKSGASVGNRDEDDYEDDDRHSVGGKSFNSSYRGGGRGGGDDRADHDDHYGRHDRQGSQQYNRESNNDQRGGNFPSRQPSRYEEPQQQRTMPQPPAPPASSSGPGGVAGKQVRVLYDFTAEGPGELSICKGDVLTVVVEIDSGWWEGEYPGGEKGMFPSNYVKLVEPALPARPAPPPKKSASAASGLGGSGGSLQSSYGSGNNMMGRRSEVAPPGRTNTFNPTANHVQQQPSAQDVAACNICGCDEFKLNAFKAGGQCVNCYHKH